MYSHILVDRSRKTIANSVLTSVSLRTAERPPDDLRNVPLPGTQFVDLHTYSDKFVIRLNLAKVRYLNTLVKLGQTIAKRRDGWL